MGTSILSNTTRERTSLPIPMACKLFTDQDLTFKGYMQVLDTDVIVWDLSPKTHLLTLIKAILVQEWTLFTFKIYILYI